MVMSSGYTLLYIVPSRLVHLRQVHPLNLLYDLLASNDVDTLAKC